MNTQITKRPVRRENLALPVGFGETGLDRLFRGLLDFDGFFNGRPVRMLGETGFLPENALAVDLSETDSEVIVRASVPGFTPDQIEAEVHENVLTIRAQKDETEETTEGPEGERMIRRERRFNSFYREIPLPTMVSEEKTKAKLVHGELELRLPKIEDHKPRKIKIS